MVFVPTCFEDFTTTLLLPFLERETAVFRFDIDRFRDYRWDFSPGDFSVRDPSGLEITGKALSCFYLRKPMFFDALDVPKGGLLENWSREEVSDCFRDLYSQCAAAGLCALVRPDGRAWRKPRQMRVAAKYFAVPEWHLVQGDLSSLPPGRDWVVKTLTQTRIGEGKCLFVREADPAGLDPRYPWFLQTRLEGGVDETVVFVNGRLFAFASPPRGAGSYLDSRRTIVETAPKWKPFDVPEKERAAILSFMAETGLSFGRLDFIRKDGVLCFLELNPNGQWAWLDEGDECGLFSAVAEEILAVERRGRTLADAWRG